MQTRDKNMQKHLHHYEGLNETDVFLLWVYPPEGWKGGGKWIERIYLYKIAAERDMRLLKEMDEKEGRTGWGYMIQSKPCEIAFCC